MSDIYEDEVGGEYTVTIIGPFGPGEWSWHGYAGNSVDALNLAATARAGMFSWSQARFQYVLDGEGLIDPDCRDGKHGSCVGEPCECRCHP